MQDGLSHGFDLVSCFRATFDEKRKKQTIKHAIASLMSPSFPPPVPRALFFIPPFAFDDSLCVCVSPLSPSAVAVGGWAIVGSIHKQMPCVCALQEGPYHALLLLNPRTICWSTWCLRKGGKCGNGEEERGDWRWQQKKRRCSWIYSLILRE